MRLAWPVRTKSSKPSSRSTYKLASPRRSSSSSLIVPLPIGIRVNRIGTRSRVGSQPSLAQVAAHDRRPAGWQIDPGSYRVLIGRSSADIVAEHRIEVV